MKVLFVYTNVGTYNPPNFQHGLGSLSAFLKAAGHETGLISLDQPSAEYDFLRAVARHSPDLVGFHANSPQWAVTKELALRLKRVDRSLPIVFGGTHATTMPESVLLSGAADYVVRGEGEEALLDLAEALEHGGPVAEINNLGLIERGRPRLNPVRPLIEDLDSLPFADHSIFNYQHILDANLGEAPYMAGRGCPYACSYCCNNFLQKIYKGKGRYTRFRAPEKVIEELVALRRAYSFDSIYFQDDTFTLDKTWLADFAERYKREIALPYRAQARVDLVDEEMVDLLANSGCVHINFGIEAGDERIRREVMHRKISDHQIITAFDLARSRGIKLWSYNIIGSPGEGETEIRRTIELNRKLEPDHVQVSIFNPYPGTELYQRCVDEEAIDPEIADQGLPQTFFVELPAINRTAVSDQRLKELYEEFVQLGMQLAARRDPAGYLDFAERIDSAEITSSAADHVSLQVVHLDNQERLCLFEHPPARVSFEAEVADHSRLHFGIALNPQVWERDSDGVRFSVEVDGELGFSREINPSRRPEHRRWMDFDLPLESRGGQRRTITFITEPVSTADYGWALWSRPHLKRVADGS